MAAEHHIPVMNLAAMTPRAACERLLGTPRSALRVTEAMALLQDRLANAET